MIWVDLFEGVFKKLLTLIGLLSVWFLYLLVFLNSGSVIYLDPILIDYPIDDFKIKINEFDSMVKYTNIINNVLLVVKISIIIGSIVRSIGFNV